MKKKHILWGLGLLMAGGIVLGSCTKDNDNTNNSSNKTIVPIGTEDYIVDILSIIPDSLETKFFREFGTIPEGFVPPKIEGSYKMNPKQRVSSNYPGFSTNVDEENDVYVRFTEQINELVKLDLKEDENVEVHTDRVFVRGDGDAFVAYCVENKKIEPVLNEVTYHVEIERAIVMKGRITSDGISDFRYATIILDSEDDYNGVTASLEKGYYYIYKDGDGIAEKFDW